MDRSIMQLSAEEQIHTGFIRLDLFAEVLLK